MIILSVETTCDETAVALVRDGREVLTDQIFSQADLHAVYGGVVPEIASRSHVEVIYQLADRAIAAAGIARTQIDAVAVSFAPGLIGAVLVGVNFAKSVASALGVPLIPVHHIRGHMAANYLAYPELEPPFVCLAISGGNSLIVDVRDYTDMRVMGATRDDAAGECFDKVARVLGLGYPGGRPLDELSRGGDDTKYHFPVAKVEGHPYDMSFSGLKTAVINRIHTAAQRGESVDRADVAAGFQEAVVSVLTEKSVRATLEQGASTLALAGGVSANKALRARMAAAARKRQLRFCCPEFTYCTDNAAMIGCAGHALFLRGALAPLSLNGSANAQFL